MKRVVRSRPIRSAMLLTVSLVVTGCLHSSSDLDLSTAHEILNDSASPCSPMETMELESYLSGRPRELATMRTKIQAMPAGARLRHAVKSPPVAAT